jgi:hypothetical protein
MSMGVMFLILGGVWFIAACACIGVVRGGSDYDRTN